MSKIWIKLLVVSILILVNAHTAAAHRSATQQPGENEEATAVASQFAPLFLQELGSERRYDYITRIDFDNDWVATNNWEHARDYPLPAYIYYSVTSTETHYFLHYIVFHPRDWKGGLRTTKALDEAQKFLSPLIDPRRLFLRASLSHENDLEGVLVVVARDPSPHVVFAETFEHNNFEKLALQDYAERYDPRLEVGVLALAQGRPVFVIEPKGHGIHGMQGGKISPALTYAYTGTAEDPEKVLGTTVSYDLLSIYDTLWSISSKQGEELFHDRQDFSRVSVLMHIGQKVEKFHIQHKKIGMLLQGSVGTKNAAALPWKWGSPVSKWKAVMWRFGRKLSYRGTWFFDPARVVKEDFNLGKDFSQVYVYHPYVAVQ